MKQTTIAQLIDLKGKAALVTGGAMGIGKSVSTRLAEAGAAVMIGDVNQEEGRKTADELKALGYRAAFVPLDISKMEDIQSTAASMVDIFGSFDILVNNAGIFPFAPLATITESLWDKTLDINLKGAFFMAQAAARQMVAAGKGGRIINIASVDGLHPTGNLIHYDSSKGGMIMMTRSLAVELGHNGILVNAVAPGGIQTPGAAQGSAAFTKNMTPEQLKAMVDNFNAKIPLGRQGDPDEIARAVLFFASNLSNYVTGETLVVDGGYLVG